MSFFTSLSGLKAAQTDLNVISNNVANTNSTGFKKSRALFGDLFAAAPTQQTKSVAGQGVREPEQPGGLRVGEVPEVPEARPSSCVLIRVLCSQLLTPP